jgi:hypothetical protein
VLTTRMDFQVFKMGPSSRLQSTYIPQYAAPCRTARSPEIHATESCDTNTLSALRTTSQPILSENSVLRYNGAHLTRHPKFAWIDIILLASNCRRWINWNMGRGNGRIIPFHDSFSDDVN